ncbi:MAG: hypothetical protein VX938_04800 [Myxococcota bacterium]|nr:hypothetical protein [Myxococcota bacterium]MEE2780153.1 hypothetical protein [Myxococcota bacterium]
MMADSPTARLPEGLADEIAWDLLRDEWEVLMAVGTGPTSLADLVDRTAVAEPELTDRLSVLVDHGLLKLESEGYGLIPVVHRRQEGMASYLDDLVLSRIDPDGPHEALVTRGGDGPASGLARFHTILDEEVFPRVVELASSGSPESQRYVIVYIAASEEGLAVAEGASSAGFLQVLRAGALERSSRPDGPARVWVAEISVEPAIAEQITRLLVGAVDEVPRESFGGALTLGVWRIHHEDV